MYIGNIVSKNAGYFHQFPYTFSKSFVLKEKTLEIFNLCSRDNYSFRGPHRRLPMLFATRRKK